MNDIEIKFFLGIIIYFIESLEKMVKQSMVLLMYCWGYVRLGQFLNNSVYW